MAPFFIFFSSLLSLVVLVSADFYSSSNPHDEPCYVVNAPRVVRPGQVFRVSVVVCREEGSPPAEVRAALQKDGQEIASATQLVEPSTLTILILRTPTSLSHGIYSLTVEGKHPKLNLSFKNTTELEFQQKFLSILVHTSRPLYQAGQLVRFRILILRTDLTPYDDGLDVFIVDPDGFVMRRWLSAFTNIGVASLSFRLPKLAKEGFWKVRVKAQEQIEEQKIKVETYFPQLFEVYVELPTYILDTEKAIVGKVYGMSTSERMARGNVTLKLYAENTSIKNDTRKLVWEQTLFLKSKAYDVKIPMSRVTGAVAKLSRTEVTLEATMTESLFAMTASGFSKSRILASSLNLRFLTSSPCYFKPGMPFHIHAAVSYQYNERVSADILARSQVKMLVAYDLGSGGSISMPEFVVRGDRGNVLSTPPEQDQNDIVTDPLSQESYLQKGVLGFNFIIPNKTEKVYLTASYSDVNGNTAVTRLKCLKYQSPKNKYLSVWTTNEDAVAGEYAIFHVKSNFRMSRCHYLVVSKNYIINGADIEVSDLQPTITSFPVALSADMAPGFRLLVFHVAYDKRIIADSVFVPVYAFRKYPLELSINMGKDFKGDTVEVFTSGDVGSYIGFHATRAVIYKMQAGNEITESRVTDSLLSFEQFNSSLRFVMWQSRDGLRADKTVYYSSMDDGSDVNRTFHYAGLLTFSHTLLQDIAEGACANSVYSIPCANEGCYSDQQKCDGRSDCGDSSDEMNCPPRKDDDYEYRIGRTSRFSFLYDAEQGDWAWREVKTNDHKGLEGTVVKTPFVADDWYFNAYTLSPNAGFSTNRYPILHSTKRPFTAHISGPEWCHRGEQVGLRLILLNHDKIQALVFVRLIGSPDYKFVHVESSGVVSSYDARLTSGDHHLLVYIAPESQTQVDFPVAPTIEQGSVEVKFVASSQAARSFLSHKMEVLPEGAILSSHTAVFLDLKNRAYVLNYLDVIVEESPIVPYQEWRRYIYGSPKGSISVTGDIIGPAFPEMPLTKAGVLGVHGKGTDARIFEFAMNIWTLHYLRLTNKLHLDRLKEVLEASTTILAHVMKRFNPNGWFTNWDSSPPSVWLTAWVLRMFKHAVYADWENILFIDANIFDKGIGWLIQNQSPNGNFFETDSYYYPLDTKMKLNGSNVALTAQVLITLSECLEILDGTVRSKAIPAALNAARYLEVSVNTMNDPYQLAITSYALTLAKSNEMESAFRSLHSFMRHSTDGLLYWSKTEMPDPPTKLENQRSFTQPRSYYEGDTEAVETTAYALLTLLHKDGVTPMADKVVPWLITMKMTSSGFISTVDTIVAMQALTEYANQAGLMDITKMDVTINMASNGEFKHTYHIGNTSEHFDSEIPNVWGQVNVVAKGAGFALVQMDVSFGIDYEPLKDFPTYESFKLEISEYYSVERNKSALTIQSCLRWLREYPPVSGAAVLEIDIPSGYHLIESEAVAIAEGGYHPTLRDAQTMPGKTLWFFDYVPAEWSCFNHTVRRWYPVANMTLYRQALLYEINARERFEQVLVNSTPLYVLNICEVCGSYQCPYCPYYNMAIIFQPIRVLLTTILFHVVYNVL